MSVLTGQEEYADDILDEIGRAVKKVYAMNATEYAAKLGNVKATNIVLLGALVRQMGLETIDWESIIRKSVKERFVDLNLRAFQIGADYVSEAAYY